MLASMAGAAITGALVASTVADSASSAMPHASFARVLAVAGAMMTASARSAMATWSMPSSVRGSKGSTTTGRWVMAAKVRGATNLVALRVMMTSTRAPCWRILLAKSTAL